MAAAFGPALLVCLCVVLLPAVTGLQSEDVVCAFTDQVEGRDSHSRPANELRGAVGENGTIRCSRGSRCYGLWEKRPGGEIHLFKQGCWPHIGHQQECRGDRCLVTAPPSQIQNSSYRFCCCSRNLCNINFTEAPPTANTPALRVTKTDSRGNGGTARRLLRHEATALIALVTVAIAAGVILTLFLCYRMMRGKKKSAGLSALAVMEAADADADADAAVDPDDLKLLELIGRGRYGTVFRSRLNERCVAVKLFSSANRQNFLNERAIYCLPLLQQHDNIARFLTADERMTADGRPEFLILMEFYPHGCLSHYLSLHTVDWSTCCRMTQGVTRGLAFLHTELSRGDQYKPAVAHRDVTSRNILVRADLSCVLADFGLSMRLTTSRPCCPGDDDTMAISEVGTVRYMAPEVLGGALNLRDCESALKQVDVYALGLLYWESFRRCSQLFPGEAVPEYQPAFQEELGNHPSFEQMQILVVREKFRPRFPEAWKVNSLALRSLKETMEDCWDQDAEARLTAQCAEERLSDLALLTTHTAIHNHRNLSHGRSSPQVGSTSSYIEDQQVGVVKNIQGDVHPASAVRTTTSGSEGVEKNRNSINYERQLAKARSSRSDSSVSAITARTTGSILCSVSESDRTSDAGPTVPVRLQLTEEDLEATKLDPEEVQRNLRESSDENLMELSQKTFGATEQQTTNLLYRQTLQPAEVLPAEGDLGAVGGPDAPPVSCFSHPLPKQQNLLQRPTSLHLLPKPKDPASTSRFKLGKLKSNQKQVETGVAKMNTVTVGTAVAPHLVTTVTNNTSVKGLVHAVKLVTNGCSSGVPTLVKNGALGQTNPAGPQLEEGGATGGEDPCLNFSPDEHEPLLRREQPPAQSPPALHQHPHHQPGPGNVPSGNGPNSNNNNNRVAVGSEVEIRGLKVGPKAKIGSEVIWGGGGPTEAEPHISQHVSGPPASAPISGLENKILLPGPAGGAESNNVQTLQARPTGQVGSQGSYQGPEPALTPQSTTTPTPTPTPTTPTAHVADPTALGSGCSDPDSGSARSSSSQVSQAQETTAKISTFSSKASDSQTLPPDIQSPKTSNPEAAVSVAPEAPLPEVPVPEAPVPEAPVPEVPVPEVPVPEVPVPEVPAPEVPVPEAPKENQIVSFSGAASETPALKAQALESETTASARDPSALQRPFLAPLTPGLLRSQMGPPRAKRPERPSSLDLSASCMYSDDASLTESLSASGEKIKRRVKTPYTLKKWRPASWVVSTDTALDLDLEFTSSSSSQTQSSSSAQRPGGFGVPHIYQSKSSMAVFWVGGGATATTTSEPDGTTSF